MDGAVVGSVGVLPCCFVACVGVHETRNRWRGETGGVDVAASHGPDQSLLGIDRSWPFSGEFIALTNNVCDLGGGKCADQQSALHCILFLC